MTALVLVFPPEEQGGFYDVLPFIWKPAEGLQIKEERDRAPYTRWRDQKHLETTPGKTIDYPFVAEKLGYLRNEYQIEGIAYDRTAIDRFLSALSGAGVDAWIDKGGETPINAVGLRMVPWGQGFIGMGPAFTALEDVLLEEKLRHGMHPVLTWNAASAKMRTDPAGNRKFDKIKSTGRIDGVVALAMALGLARNNPAPAASMYETVSLGVA